MGAQPKFLFDTDFAAGAEQRPTITVADHEAKLAEREAIGFRNGLATAEARINDNAQQQIANTITMIGEGIDRLLDRLQSVEAKLEAEAVEVAVAVARKLAPALIEREPFAEIAALTSECFQHLISKPHVVVRVNDVSYDEAKERLEQIASSRGFEGRLVVLAEPDMLPGDCKVEWADGGVTRDREMTESAITEAVSRYVNARGTNPEQQHEQKHEEESPEN